MVVRTILHVDMDAFFASVEQLHHPEWRGRPVIVGAGPHERGVVSTCSYEARRFGVHSAMPSRTAYQLCPHAIFAPPNMELYQETSERAFEVFSHYSPFIEGVSIDEAFLDISGTVHLHPSPTALGEALRREIRSICGITCSVGIAPNRLLAKLGSEEHKPDGLTVMPFDPDEIARFLAPKPVGVLWGVGKKAVEALRPYGIVTCGDVQRAVLRRRRGEVRQDLLAAVLGDAGARTLAEYAFGRDSSEVAWEAGAEKSVSREHTFGEDEYDRETVRAKLLELVGEVGLRFRRETRWARTAKLKLRDADFNTITRQASFGRPARDDFAFRAKALELFDRESVAGGVRLIGFGVTNIQDSPDDGAPTLFADEADLRREKHERLSDALDALRERGIVSNIPLSTSPKAHT